MFVQKIIFAAWLLVSVQVEASCPYAALKGTEKSSAQEANVARQIYENRVHHHRRLNPNERTGDGGIPDGGYAAVREDIKTALITPQDFFPPDFIGSPGGPTYGGLMIRLAWHCNGSHRDSDGRGGCDGARLRFEPEASWPDNANLDMAMELLRPIKEKYGRALSWGDLIVLAGDTAIESMGGPVLGFCGGRIDDPDGSNSLLLGFTNAQDSDAQESLAPCRSIGQQGNCSSPLGASTVGLIYVNPAGPVGNQSNPVASALDIRNVFGRMGFNDRESVALIGGGHAFGKAHGPCTSPPCGSGPSQGIGINTFTSGFEGAWSTIPTQWSNEYFNNLFDFNWTLIDGPGGNPQWIPDSGFPNIMMLTADRALSEDSIYEPISREFASDLQALESEFSAAWFRLMTADMGPPIRCLGPDVPPPQPWQHALPTAPDSKPDFEPAADAIRSLIADDGNHTIAFLKLALNCAFTFRETDYRGGCNGARIRFEPEIGWESNAGAADALATLESIKISNPDISYADLIVLAGHVSMESATGRSTSFCGGRVDASDAEGSDDLAPRVYESPLITIQDDIIVKGLTFEEGVALRAEPSYGNTTTLSNQFFVDLKAGDGNFTAEQNALLEGQFAAIVDSFIADNELFITQYMSGFTKMMTADRYDGPVLNACDGVSDNIGSTAPDNSNITTTGTANSNMPTDLAMRGQFVEPEWWPRLVASFDGVRLRRCSKRNGIIKPAGPPPNGESCSRTPKTCFFGDQDCAGLPYPATQCFCDGNTWQCSPATCSSTE